MLLLLATSAVARSVAADDDPQDPVAATGTQPPQGEATVLVPTPTEPTAADVAGAPPPGSESGRLDVEPADSAAREVARSLLMFPRLTVYAVEAPVMGTLWLTDRYQLQQKYYDWFYNDDRTLAIIPSGSFVSGFGVSVGAKALERNYLGYNEYSYIEGTFGLDGRMDHRLLINTGDWLGERLQADLFANYDIRPRDRFFGIGNGDQVHFHPTAVMPFTSDIAYDTRYKYKEARVGADLDYRVWRDLHLIPSFAYASIKTQHSNHGVSIESVYDPNELITFDDRVHHGYPELEVRWDTRRAVSRWDPVNVHAAGSLVSAFAGPVIQFGSPLSDFWHVGADLQQFWQVGHLPKVLSLRLRGEGVTGDYQDIPFPELPYLGGIYLRGYEYQRFRDRLAIFASGQYRWNVANNFDSYLFIDAGRVYSDWDAFTLEGLRAGFGLGIELHTNKGFLGEATIATSRDGGAFVTISLNPILDTQPRWR